VFDDSERVIYANRPAERLFNKTVTGGDSLKYGDFAGCVNRHDSPQGCGHTKDCPTCPFFRAIRGTISGEADAEVREWEALLKRDPGLDNLWVNYKVEGIMLHGRRAVVMAIEDITLHKRAETQFYQLQNAESLQRMAGAVAHHYNNMLAAVIGNLELTLENIARNARLSTILKTNLTKNLSEAMNAARRASEMGALMLAYLGQGTGRHEPLELSEICRQCVPDLRDGFPENVTFDVELPSPGPAVDANADEIRQIIRSVVTNAREALEVNPGTVSFRVITVPGPDIPDEQRFPVEFRPEAEDYACIEVMDDGCGVSEADVERIFDPFFSTKFTGRGLGLSVALGAVKAHGGCVTMEGRGGRGSVFRVYLPLSEEPVQQLSVALEGARAPLKDVSVLLIEDEAMVRRAAAAMLDLMGIRVLEAGDGSQGVKIFLQHKDEVACVLCDLTMPGMDGWETLEALRRLSPGIPVILTSGYDEGRVMQGEHSERPQAFLGKPYRITELEELIVKVVTGK
jgi:signal transduction histidine kinase/CheY-like chemotaxis protein